MSGYSFLDIILTNKLFANNNILNIMQTAHLVERML